MRGYPRVPVAFISVSVASAFLFSARAGVNVTQHHNHYTRDGLYIDPAFTYSAASNLVRDLNFNGTISGDVNAQPLYIEGGPAGPMIIAATESNNVYALNAASGNVIWQDHLGAPVPRADLPCGNIDPLGITGTPVVDLTNRTLFVDAMTTPDGGTTKEHLIYALNVDTGATNAGWPVNVNATAQFNGTNFTSFSQNQRGALAFLDGYVYVPYGGHAGDCSFYWGWLVGVQETNPANVHAWAANTYTNKTPAAATYGGGSWGVGGVASDDGIHPFIATGNDTMYPVGSSRPWSGSEGIFRFQPGPVFSYLTNDFWAATNWQVLDEDDLDIGGSGPVIVDVPGASPSNLVVALGKDGSAYLLNRTNLGGINIPVTRAFVSAYGGIINAAATYRTTQGTYVAFNAGSYSGGDEVSAFRIGATAPPTIIPAWTNRLLGEASPFVTSTDGTNNAIVWIIGAENDQRLHGFNGDTGAVVFNGGGTNELLSNTRHFQTAIAARGRIYIGTDNKIIAFTVPVPPIVLGNWTVFPNGAFQFGFTNTPGLSFTVYGTTNLILPFASWTQLGAATETAPGQFQFTDTTTAKQDRFYRVTSP